MIHCKQNKQIAQVIRCCISNPQIIQYMVKKQYPIWQCQKENLIQFNLPLNNYICLRDLLIGKKNKLIKFNNDALEIIFIMLYDQLLELKKEQMMYFIIRTEYVWVQINDKVITKLILTSPTDNIESIYEQGSNIRIKRTIFQEILTFFEKKSNKTEQLFKKIMEKDMHCVKELKNKIHRNVCILIEDNLKQFINNNRIVDEFILQNHFDQQDKLYELLFEHIPYFTLQNKIQKKDPKLYLFEIQNQFQKVNQICQLNDKSRYGLSIFLEFPQIILLFNDLQRFVQGDFLVQFQQFLTKAYHIIQLFEQIKSQISNFSEVHILQEIERLNLYQDHVKLLEFITEYLINFSKEQLSHLI